MSINLSCSICGFPISWHRDACGRWLRCEYLIRKYQRYQPPSLQKMMQKAAKRRIPKKQR